LVHAITTSTESVFLVNDLSRLMTRLRRINTSWAGGTPDITDSKGLTDLFVSPEVKEQIRAFAFNAMNTQGAGGLALANDSRANGIPLPEATRQAIFNGAGMEEIYGVSISELLELGTSRRYNTLFDEFAASNSAFGHGGEFVDGDDELAVGFDLSKDAFIRPISRDSETGATFTTLADDQFVARSEKVGLYGSLEEGRLVIDSRGVCGVVI
ncbi:MAG: hypothetical protein AABY22_04710, partial [Nanoarchaeota archaeon]